MPAISYGWDAFANPVPGNVLACLDELGVEDLRESGDEVHGKCPAHVERTGKQDRHPSWSVNTDTGAHNCFSCGFQGNWIHLATYLLKGTDEDPVAWTRARGGVERAKKILEKHKARSIEELDTTENINEASLALFTDPPAEALESRGLTLEAAQKFGVLWDPKEGSWIIPIREPYTETLMGYQVKNKRFFLNHPEDMQKSTALFGFNEHDADITILVESPLDVVRLESVGIQGGVSSFGVEVSDAQMRLAIDCAPVLIVGLDNDRSGDRISKKIRDEYSRRVRMRFLSYEHCPDVKDIGEMSEEEIYTAVDKSITAALARFNADD